MGKDLDSLRLLCTAGTVGGALLLIGLERRFPYNKNQRFWREGFFTDFVWYTLVQSFVLGIVISYVIQWIDGQTGLSRITAIREQSLGWQLLFFLVTHDFYIYWFHRWQHHSKILWRVHEAHHSARDVDWLAGSRSHALEILINQSVEFLPLVLLGSPEIAVIKGMVDAVWGMYIHSNINVRSSWLQYIINGPEMHRWHHADEEEAYNRNFSTKFAFWDWIFRTDFFPRQRQASRYGLGDVNFPKKYLKQQAFAFRKFEKETGQNSAMNMISARER